MSASRLRESTLYRGGYLAVSLAVLFLDQWTKGIITRTMDVHQSRTVIANVFDITYVRNSGAAFGLFASVDSAMKAILLNSVAVIVFLIVSAYALRSSHKSVRLQLGLALILGGAVGNLLDRVRFGYVVDFLDFSISGHHWPAFNVADSAICIGVAVLFLDMLRQRGGAQAGPRSRAGGLRDSTHFPAPRPHRTVLPADLWRRPGDRLPDGHLAAPAQGPRGRTCRTRRSWTSRLYILASAILGAKLLLILVEWRRYVANPKDLDRGPPLGRRLLWRTHRRHDRGDPRT